MRPIIILFILAMVAGCSNEEEAQSPKEVATNFLVYLKKMEYEKAHNLIIEENKHIFSSAKTTFQNSKYFQAELEQSKQLSGTDILSALNFDNTTEMVSNNSAIVQSADGNNKIILEKRNERWFVVCDNKLLISLFSETQRREEVFSKFRKLLQVYDDRNEKALTIPDLKTDAIREKIIQIKNEGNDINNIQHIIDRNEELSKMINEISSQLYTKDVSWHDVGSIQLRIMSVRSDYNYAVSVYNSGFGKKFEYIKADVRSENAPQVQF